MNAESKLGMSLDDIISKGKKQKPAAKGTSKAANMRFSGQSGARQQKTVETGKQINKLALKKPLGSINPPAKKSIPMRSGINKKGTNTAKKGPSKILRGNMPRSRNQVGNNLRPAGRSNVPARNFNAVRNNGPARNNGPGRNFPAQDRPYRQVGASQGQRQYGSRKFVVNNRGPNRNAGVPNVNQRMQYQKSNYNPPQYANKMNNNNNSNKRFGQRPGLKRQEMGMMDTAPKQLKITIKNDSMAPPRDTYDAAQGGTLNDLFTSMGAPMDVDESGHVTRTPGLNMP